MVDDVKTAESNHEAWSLAAMHIELLKGCDLSECVDHVRDLATRGDLRLGMLARVVLALVDGTLPDSAAVRASRFPDSVDN
jgi:hypothetical protein